MFKSHWDLLTSSMKSSLFLEQHGYTFQKNLGEGRYGKVVQGYSNCMRKNFAVKIIDLKKVDAIYLDKFLPREKEIVKALNHPNIIRTYNIFEQSSSKVFVVMELCVNRDLCQYIKNKGPLSEESGCRFFIQLCAAVQYLHGIDVMHRDLKCENLLLDRHNNIKVCDFGLSKRLTYTDGRADLSKTYCGTSNYASPEILRSVPYDPIAADVWSMGVVLFKMLYAALPFDSTNVKKMVQSQMRRSINFPDTPSVSPPAVTLIQNILHPDTKYRLSIANILQSPWVVQAGWAEGSREPSPSKDGPTEEDAEVGPSVQHCQKAKVKKK